jgi:hypothetical protein
MVASTCDLMPGIQAHHQIASLSNPGSELSHTIKTLLEQTSASITLPSRPNGVDGQPAAPTTTTVFMGYTI